MQHYDGGEGLITHVVDLESENWPNPFADDFIVEVNLVTGFSGVHLNHNHPLNDTLINMENVTLKGDVNSVLIGDNNDNIIKGGSGDDILRGGAGNDILKSGYGNDYVYGDRGNDVLILNGSETQAFDGGEGVILNLKLIT